MTLKKHSSSFVRNLWQTIAVLILFAITFNIYVYSEKQLDRANEMRLRSFVLADELRQSSDDLTRMVRTYIVTKNPLYKEHYQEILDIRNGLKTRPINYQNIYWDLVGLDNKRPRPYSNQALPLIEMMRQAGFTKHEFDKLTEAKNNSDTLTETEFAAMKLIESKDSEIQMSRQQQKALELLHDEAYHNAKASIMRPIDEFYVLMSQRTAMAVHNAQVTAFVLRILFVLIGLFLLFMLWRLNKTLNALLGSSVDDLYTHIKHIGQGNFSIPITVKSGEENSILGWLGETQSTLKNLITSNERLKQLYAALSQCNQAIVRCKDKEELFPIICRDAVIFGGMKMASISMLNEENQQMELITFYGESTEYTNKLPLYRNGKAVGVFTLYAQEIDAFDKVAQKLLKEMAMDISFALESFERDTARKEIETALQKSQKHLLTIIENEPECVKLVDLKGKLIEMNPAGLRMLEVDTLEEAQRYTLASYILPQWRAPFIELYKRVINGENAILEFEIQGLKGTRRWLETHAAPLRDHNGNITMLLGITRDTTQRKHNEEQIRYLANYDSLTGLPNRAQLDLQIKNLLSLAKRNDKKITVMFLDLDHFKDINDTLGHSVGDTLLIQASARLQSLLREEDMIARLGGDEFIILLPNIQMNGATQVAQKLLEIFAHPFQIKEQELSISASIGIALYPNDGTDFETLYKNADTAMYRAKHEGRNGYCFFTNEMQEHSARNLELSNALRHALEKNQFQLHYQPQISSKDGKIIGAEALLRWHHPEHGNISPLEFIPILEENGLILLIGEWVLRTAVSQAKEWMEQGSQPIIMAVNISAVQFRHLSLPDTVSSILREVGLPPEYLELELTESVAMHDPQKAIDVMNNLHDRGIRMSIDDFGTGYSSLSHLKKFKVYKLKIDQSFVRDITIDQEDKAIVSAIISMSKRLGLQTIAEGVETAEQLEYLQQEGCDEIQGFFYSQPLSAREFEAFRNT
ncbi:MAG: EAL domain-containing protein [Sulfuricurvum sp.]|nr:EAL domain-containing protein [Sulfuricurvum sp.]